MTEPEETSAHAAPATADDRMVEDEADVLPMDEPQQQQQRGGPFEKA